MIKKIAIGLAAMVAFAAPAQAATLLGVDRLNNLVRFQSNNPGVSTSVAITGLGGASVVAMDIRVRDGFLYALTDTKQIFRINGNTGAATLYANTLALSGNRFAFDFNPVNTNLRIVSNDDSNYVYTVSSPTPTLNPGATVAYGMGGPANKDIVAAAYTFNDNDLTTTGTTLFVIDSLNDLLATQNAMTGVLTQIGSLGFDFESGTSFDIVTRGLTNTAFAYSGSTLYSINLGTGAASVIGNTNRDLFALTAAIPEPATWAMMILGFGFIGGALRAQKRRWGTLATA